MPSFNEPTVRNSSIYGYINDILTKATMEVTYLDGTASVNVKLDVYKGGEWIPLNYDSKDDFQSYITQKYILSTRPLEINNLW